MFSGSFNISSSRPDGSDGARDVIFVIKGGVTKDSNCNKTRLTRGKLAEGHSHDCDIADQPICEEHVLLLLPGHHDGSPASGHVRQASPV